MLAALLNSDKSRSRTQETPEDLLQAAFEQVMAFSPRKVEQLALPTETILDLAQKESAFGRISVDSHGLTQGMRVHLGQPARNFMQEWPYIRAPFDTAVLPLQHNAEAMGRISAEIEDLQAVCDKKKAAIEAQAKGDQKYVGVHDAYTEKKREYERLKEGESRREAVVFAYSPYYKLLLLLMFIAEWLINQRPPAKPEA